MCALEIFSFLSSKLDRLKRIIKEQGGPNYETDNPLLDVVLNQCNSLSKNLDILEFQDFPPRSIRNIIKDANNNNLHDSDSSSSNSKEKKISNKNNIFNGNTPNPDDFFDLSESRNGELNNKIEEEKPKGKNSDPFKDMANKVNKKLMDKYDFSDIEKENYKEKNEWLEGETHSDDIDVFAKINIQSARNNILKLDYTDPKIKTLCIPNYSKIAFILEKEDALELWSLLLQLGVKGDIKGRSGAVKRKHNARIREKLNKIDEKYSKFLNIE